MDWFITWQWQGLLLVGLVGLASSLSPRISASTRYAIWWLTLGVVLLMPWLISGSAVVSPASAAIPARQVAEAVGPATAAPVVLPAVPVEVVLLLLGVWVMYVLVRLAGVARGARQLLAMRRSCVPFPVEAEARLARWQEVRSEGRVATLCLSRRIRVASVLGLGRPIIAIPPRLADSLSDDELDQIVLHEHGHVQRWDDWARLVQAVVDAVVGLHPAVWVISRRLDLEREVACDDWALVRSGRRREYAVCLTKVASVSRSAPVGLAPGVSLSRPTLSRRVARLLDRRRNVNVPVARGVLAAGLAGLALVAVALGSLTPVVAFEAIGFRGPAVFPIRGQVAMSRPFTVSSAPRWVPILTQARPAAASDSEADAPGQTFDAALVAAAVPVVGGAPAKLPGAGLGLPYASNVAGDDVPSTRGSLDASERAELLAELVPAPREQSLDGLASVLVSIESLPESDADRWRRRLAEAGLTIGSKTKEAGLATASFLSRVGKSIARVF